MIKDIKKETIINVDKKSAIALASTTDTKEIASEYQQQLQPLMPELEELVKKNPNKLIGCGG